MNLPTKHYLKFIGIGMVVGLLGLAAFIVALIMVSKDSPVYSSITSLFTIINKPLDLIPWLEFLGEQQDPILNLAVMAIYWAALGILIGTLAFAVSIWRQKNIK
jgi:hypothetical protein